eukprot:TRINITY_DN61352_c0_g1_i1.p1 TRINITY_DN61352_c0_g1~~TRINITY_DN61352_c0_g1_i1.p1  ORF type:complete len:147 (+),score=13.62 TRINITY_DN61352_c0_g1_i1:210-650(+)
MPHLELSALIFGACLLQLAKSQKVPVAPPPTRIPAEKRESSCYGIDNATICEKSSDDNGPCSFTAMSERPCHPEGDSAPTAMDPLFPLMGAAACFCFCCIAINYKSCIFRKSHSAKAPPSFREMDLTDPSNDPEYDHLSVSQTQRK